MRGHRKAQTAERLAAGKIWQDSGFVFTGELGRPLHPRHVSDQSYLLSASLMVAAGVDLTIVRETLGHVSSTFTRDTYTSVYPEVARAAAESTAALIHAVPDTGHDPFASTYHGAAGGGRGTGHYSIRAVNSGHNDMHGRALKASSDKCESHRVTPCLRKAAPAR
ncbi:hypothetical protein HCN51_37500 [Nonomuraea sp. FMUSA5-5]|uniref:Tyr recombinase domain-containing protein n=1 Tax=Nonomuraea composti TaxID=2720023 RepID=A0ABX1BDZ4_9ACTN|nr:hypothetical protein [Nonomuraea sp. FMUSA5-5]NJP95072.1 hypothetical protein [Nonomuraea sp. FMUSA5-5]